MRDNLQMHMIDFDRMFVDRTIGDDNVSEDAEDYSSPSDTILFPSPDMQQELDEMSERFQDLNNLDDHVKLKDRLVDAFYNAVEHAFGLQQPSSIDYDVRNRRRWQNALLETY